MKLIDGDQLVKQLSEQMDAIKVVDDRIVMYKAAVAYVIDKVKKAKKVEPPATNYFKLLLKREQILVERRILERQVKKALERINELNVTDRLIVKDMEEAL